MDYMLPAHSGIWTSMPEVIARAPEGWKNEHLDNVNIEAEGEKEDHDISLSEKERRSTCRRCPTG